MLWEPNGAVSGGTGGSIVAACGAAVVACVGRRSGVPSGWRRTGTSQRDVPTVLDVAVRRRCLGLAEAEPERFEVTGFFPGDGEIGGLGCEVGLEDGTVSGVEGGAGALGETFRQEACGICGEE